MQVLFRSERVFKCLFYTHVIYLSAKSYPLTCKVCFFNAILNMLFTIIILTNYFVTSIISGNDAYSALPLYRCSAHSTIIELLLFHLPRAAHWWIRIGFRFSFTHSFSQFWIRFDSIFSQLISRVRPLQYYYYSLI